MLSDLRFALRTFRRTPTLIAAAILATALGVGANTAIFSVIRAVLIKPLPYERPDRMVMIWEKNPTFTGILAERIPVARGNFEEWKRQSKSFAGMELISTTPTEVRAGERPEQLPTASVTPGFFALFGRQPAIGRGVEAGAVLTHSYWQKRFGGDPRAIGRGITVAGKSYTIAGVLPSDFHLPATFGGFGDPDRPDVWVAMPPQTGPDFEQTYEVFGRLRDGVSVEQARAEVAAVAKRLETLHPDENKGWTTSVWPLRVEDLSPTTVRTVIALQVAVGFVLLIACANVANLLLARAAGRGREFAIRTALGASRGRLIRQALVESLLLSALGAALGLLLADGAMRAINAFAPKDNYHFHEIGLDWTVLAFEAAVAVISGLVFGLLPALAGTKNSLQGAMHRDAKRWRGALVVAEVAASVVLLAGAGLMIRSLAAVMHVAPGFDPDHVLAAHIRLPESRYGKPEQVKAFCNQLLDRLGALGQVEAASISTGMPMMDSLSVRTFQVEGDHKPEPYETDVKQVSEGYFRTAGVPILRGRGFTRQEAEAEAKVVLANESFARRIFPNADPIGRAVVFGDKDRYTIVGLVPDSHEMGLEEDARPELFGPTRDLREITVMARTKGAPKSITTALTGIVEAIDRDQTVVDVKTLAEHLHETTEQRRFDTILFGGMAALALILAAVGLYGVLSYTVVLRRREIGVRMALGAQAGDVVRMVLRSGLGLTLLGVAIGGAGALALTRLMADLVFGISASDPATFAVVPVVLVGVALAACYVPARRAAAVDPMESLRLE